MFPLLFLAYVVAIKVFKKTTPNGEFTQLSSLFFEILFFSST